MAKKTAATRAAASKSTPGLGPQRRRQGEERADGGEQDERALAALRADGGDQNHAEGEGAHNGAGGVGGVDAAHQSPGIAAGRCHGRQGQRKTGAHSNAAGRMAQVARARSIWNVNQGLVESSGLMANTGASWRACRRSMRRPRQAAFGTSRWPGAAGRRRARTPPPQRCRSPSPPGTRPE